MRVPHAVLLAATTISLAVISGSSAAPAKAVAIDGCTAKVVAKNRLPVSLSLFQIDGDRIKQVSSAPRATLPATLELEDCQDPSFLGYQRKDGYYLVRKSEIALNAPCICTSQARLEAGAPGAGRLALCAPAC